MKVIIIGHNKAGELRYIETIAVNGARATGITSDRAKATEFDSWDEANAMLEKTELSATWRYSWRVREAIVKPCCDEVSCARCGARIPENAAVTDTDDEGKTWTYCSQDCLERH